MPKAHILLLSWVAVASAAGSFHCSGEGTNSLAAVAPVHPNGATKSATVIQDDLAWLVGRWRCVTRQYLEKQNHPLGSAHEDFLEYLNVYLPYADDRLTLNLTDNPQDREIAAEFLVKVIYDVGEFRERLEPMQPGGPVLIGKDRIWYGFRPFDHFEFRYSIERRDQWLWLVLTSDHMRLELMKLEHAPLGNMSDSLIRAPIKAYPSERLSEIKRRYEELKQGAHLADGAANRSQPVPPDTNRASAAAGSGR
jgi:hypothetical protein